MHPWQQFLEEQGYRFEQDRGSDALDPAATLPPDAAATGFIAPLTDLGLMTFSGEEAAHFLHNQLTNDVEHLGEQEARLAAYCSPKGRMLASLLLWRESDAIFLQLPREIQPTVQKRLQMFILRAKVKTADASDTRVVLGLGGTAATAALALLCKDVPAAPYTRVEAAGGVLIRVADAFGAPRYQWVTTPEQAQAVWPQLAQALQPAGTALWRLADILAGVPQIVKATQESFVPQMVNFEVIGGVNFRKGCYPGQEIVARSQYLGKLKRRTALAMVAAGAGAAPTAGMEVFSIADPDQPCGMLVNAEPCGPGEFAMLVELKTAALDEGSIHLGSADGPALRMQALPYALPDAA